MVLSTQKKIASVAALGLSAVLLFGSTFAWQSLNQEALNYVKGGANPGGRLHDDFNNITFQTNADGSAKFTTKTFDKDVYVENFTSMADDGVNIYARVRLDEYMEYGPNAGTSDDNEAVTVLGSSTAKLTDTSTWKTHIPGETSVFGEYWTWEMEGQATYMPTFNKNKDSLAADVNGTFDNAFADYMDYSDEKYSEKGDGRTAYAIYDADNNTADELTRNQVDVNGLIKKGTAAIPEDADWASAIRLTQETHTAKKSLNGTVMTMAQYLEKMDADEDFTGRGNFWVWDTDGWAYWANPIQPQTATGLLLNQIQRTDKTIGSGEDEWYYGINVVAQFITADDLGKESITGFYDTDKGAAPTENALELLSAIGVNTTGEVDMAMLETESVEVRDAYELWLALESGSEQITLTDDIELDEPLIVKENAYVYLNGCSITPSSAFDGRALFTLTNGAWLDFDERGSVQAPADGYAVWVEDGLLYIWDGTFIGGTGAVYVRNGEAVIVDGTFYLQGDEGQLLDWRSGDGEITVYRGTFYNFDPSDVNGESLLENGYTVEAEAFDGDTIYTVTADIGDTLPEEPVLPNEELPVAGEDGEPTVDKLPGDGTESGDAMDEETPGEENNGASPDVSGDTTDVPETSAPSVPDSSVTESTETGTLSGISGKADVVEAETPSDDGSSADDTAECSTDAETAE